MGEANRRGTKEQRIELAIIKKREQDEEDCRRDIERLMDTSDIPRRVTSKRPSKVLLTSLLLGATLGNMHGR